MRVTTRILILCSSLALLCPVIVAQEKRWGIPTYEGITLGKSKKAAVLRVFGKPKLIVHPEDEYDNPVESLIDYVYENVGGFDGRTEIIMRARTGVVIAVWLSPPYQRPFLLDRALEKYGNEYIRRESGLGPCPTAKEIREYKPPPVEEYPVFFVYPQKGVYFAVDQDKKVAAIYYEAKCP